MRNPDRGPNALSLEGVTRKFAKNANIKMTEAGHIFKKEHCSPILKVYKH